MIVARAHKLISLKMIETASFDDLVAAGGLVKLAHKPLRSGQGYQMILSVRRCQSNANSSPP